MRIQHNIAALNAHRQLGVNNLGSSKSLERLSSGFRINRAADDAAGLAVSEKMRAQVRGLGQAVKNAQDGISLIQTAEGALQEVHSMLQRIRELAVQASNGTYNAQDLEAMQQEVGQLLDEIDQISEKTSFNGKLLLKGTLGIGVDTAAGNYAALNAAGLRFDVAGASSDTTYTFNYTEDSDELSITDGSVTQVLDTGGAANVVGAGTVLNFDKLGIKITFSADTNLMTGIGGGVIDAKTFATNDNDAAAIQVGANSGEQLAITISDMGSATLGINNVDVTAGAQAAIDTLDLALTDVSGERAKLGAYQNRLEHTVKNLGVAVENLTAAESRVRDVDMAAEMMEFTKYSILNQASVAMLAQANMQPQSVLQLLA